MIVIGTSHLWILYGRDEWHTKYEHATHLLESSAYMDERHTHVRWMTYEIRTRDATTRCISVYEWSDIWRLYEWTNCEEHIHVRWMTYEIRTRDAPTRIISVYGWSDIWRLYEWVTRE